MRSKALFIGSILIVFLFNGNGSFVLAGDKEPPDEMTPEQIEAWFNDDSVERALDVNEGELDFLSEKPDKSAHHSHNRLIINNKSLSTGWVGLIQCHSELDAVPEAQIVYRYKRIKDLRIESFSGIKRAWIEGKSAQLEGIQSGARICIRADVGILYSTPKAGFILKNGPFHRKFLDGYYPMQVTLEIQYPQELIRFASITPQAQPGFAVQHVGDELHVNAWFEGELMTEIRFLPMTNRVQ